MRHRSIIQSMNQAAGQVQGTHWGRKSGQERDWSRQELPDCGGWKAVTIHVHMRKQVRSTRGEQPGGRPL